MASAGTRAAAAALLFSFFSAAVVLQAPALPGLADLVVSALDRFLGGRGVLELATRRNMILLCHAILLLILRDAGVLGAPARRRSGGSASEATAATAVVSQTAAPVPVPARPDATRRVVAAQTGAPIPARPHPTRSAVVWRRRPRNRGAAPMHEHDAAAAAAAALRLVECQPAAEASATWAAPVLMTTGPPAQAEEAAAVATKQIVVVESPRNDDDDLLDRHDRDAVVEQQLEHPTAIAADGEMGCDDRCITTVSIDDDKRMDDQTAGMEMELADDRTFEEFIQSQRRKMQQESLQLQLVSSAGYQHYQNQYQYQAMMAACY